MTALVLVLTPDPTRSLEGAWVLPYLKVLSSYVSTNFSSSFSC